MEGGGGLESGGSPAAQRDEGGRREKRKAASQGQDSPVPLALALQTRPAGTRKRSHEVVGSRGHPLLPWPTPRNPLTFSPFSPGRPATPGSPC